MFEGLPVVTDSNVTEVMDEDWPYLLDEMIRCMKETKTLDEAIDCTCGELRWQNPKLVTAIRGTVYGVLGLFEGRPEPERSGAAMAVVPSVLAVLSLISHALRDWRITRGEVN